MVRYGQSFGYMDKQHSTRPDKSSVKMKKLERRQRRSKSITEAIKKDLIEKGVDPNTNDFIKRETGLHAERKYARELQQAMENRPARLKRSCKKISKDKLTAIILDYIVKTDDDYVCKEDLAILLKVKYHEVEQVFQVLNVKGILSQRRPRYSHDTNRNPMFDGPQSGWASDSYTIYSKEKAQAFLKEML